MLMLDLFKGVIALLLL